MAAVAAAVAAVAAAVVAEVVAARWAEEVARGWAVGQPMAQVVTAPAQRRHLSAIRAHRPAHEQAPHEVVGTR